MKNESNNLFASTPFPVAALAAFATLSIYIFPYRPTANQNACKIHELANISLKSEQTVKNDMTLHL